MKYHRYSLEIKQEWVRLYLAGESSLKIADKYGVRPNTVRENLVKLNIKIRPLSVAKRKYSLDETIFEKINTPDKAYFLGLLMADGCVMGAKDGIIIALQEIDRHILGDIKIAFGMTIPLYYRKPQPKIMPNGKTSYCQGQYTLSIWSSKVKGDLIRLGVSPAKSLTLEFPNINKQFLFHFLRGYFDGDGCLTFDYRCFNKPVVSFVSSDSFCLGLKKEMEKLGFLFTISKRGKVSDMRLLGGQLQTFEFLDLMYKDANLKLDRKYQKYLIGKEKLTERLAPVNTNALN